MNELEMIEFNKGINYEDGKLYWKMGYNYSSKLFDRLKSKGYKMRSIRSFIEIYDNEGNKIVDEIGIYQALKQLSIIMR